MKRNLNKVAKNIIVVACALFIIISCVPVAQQSSVGGSSKELIYEDHIYETNIKTVTLYPFLGSQRDLLRSTAIPLSQENPLHISFDELSSESKSYYIKLVLCNADWTPSQVSSIDYIDQFNELLITDYELSQATKVQYTNYRATIPRVKIPGNYLIKVYRNKDEDDLVLTRRFMVYTNEVRINAQVRYSNVVSYRNVNHQVDFSITYPQIELINPTTNVKTVIRQNLRWDNSITLKPMFVREDQKLLEYNYFNLENNFSGGNEFRAFDIRSVNFEGMNVAKIVNTPSIREAFLKIDKARKSEPYSLFPDINGKFIVDNYDFSSDSSSGSEYLNVHFSLKNPKINKDVYVVGALTNWKLNPDYKMVYNEELERYEGNLVLKQGWYNYAYGVAGQNGQIAIEPFEGEHFETENEYEIFVYYRPVGARTDLIVGYYYVDHNKRR